MTTGETELPPGFEDDDRHGVREIEAAIARHHRQPDQSLLRPVRQDLGGQSGRLAPEKECVTLTVADLVKSLAACRFYGEHASGLEPPEAGREVRVLMHARHLVIVEAGPLHPRIAEREPERPDEV